MTVMTSIATAVVLPAALIIANSRTKKWMTVNVWVSQWQPTLLGDALSLKDGLPHFTTLGSTSINILQMWHLSKIFIDVLPRVVKSGVRVLTRKASLTTA